MKEFPRIQQQLIMVVAMLAKYGQSDSGTSDITDCTSVSQRRMLYSVSRSIAFSIDNFSHFLFNFNDSCTYATIMFSGL